MSMSNELVRILDYLISRVDVLTAQEKVSLLEVLANMSRNGVNNENMTRVRKIYRDFTK